MRTGTTGTSGGVGFSGSVIFLLFSSFGNWRYTYRAHQKYDKPQRKDAFDILDARYAKGEITREEYGLMKTEIAKE